MLISPALSPDEPLHTHPAGPWSHSLWSADHQVSFVGTIGQAEPRLRQPTGRVDADMSPLVSRHGVKDVENSLGGGKRRKKREWEEKQFVIKNAKILEKQSPFYGLEQVKDREERQWLGWEWSDTYHKFENSAEGRVESSYFR